MTLQLQELNFSLFTKSFNPKIFNVDTLYHGGIIQSDWQLAAEPISSDLGVKLVFTNKVRIVAQPNRLTFAETIGNKNLEDILLPFITQRSLQTFSNIEYQAVSLNPSAYARFNSNSQVLQYLSQGLLAADSWRTFQDQAISAVGIKLAYPNKSGNFYLDINQANIQISGATVPAIWFAGNFNYQLEENTDRNNYNLQNILNNWRSDVRNFQDFINNKLLNSSATSSVSLFTL